MPAAKVLVLNATGKVGRNVCRALLEAGFEIHGTTRSPNSPLASQGVKQVRGQAGQQQQGLAGRAAPAATATSPASGATCSAALQAPCL